MAFNSEIVTELLCGRLRFDGVVSTELLALDSHRMLGGLRLKGASAWGVERLFCLPAVSRNRARCQPAPPHRSATAGWTGG